MILDLFIFNAIKAGAKGYLLKDCSYNELIAAINSVYNNKNYISNEISDIFIQELLSEFSYEDLNQAIQLVKKEKEFQKVFTTGKSSANRNFIVYVLPKENQPHFRIGISVGKKVGNAVKRNDVKRKIRASIFELREEIQPDLDFIVIARPSVSTLTSQEVYSNLKHVLKLAKVMK